MRRHPIATALFLLFLGFAPAARASADDIARAQSTRLAVHDLGIVVRKELDRRSVTIRHQDGSLRTYYTPPKQRIGPEVKAGVLVDVAHEPGSRVIVSITVRELRHVTGIVTRIDNRLHTLTVRRADDTITMFDLGPMPLKRSVKLGSRVTIAHEPTSRLAVDVRRQRTR